MRLLFILEYNAWSMIAAIGCCQRPEVSDDARGYNAVEWRMAGGGSYHQHGDALKIFLANEAALSR